MIAIQEHINDYVTFSYKSYKFNWLFYSWAIAEKNWSMFWIIWMFIKSYPYIFHLIHVVNNISFSCPIHDVIILLQSVILFGTKSKKVRVGTCSPKSDLQYTTVSFTSTLALQRLLILENGAKTIFFSNNHTQTYTHTHIYVYIYIYRERERERERGRDIANLGLSYIIIICI